GRCVSVGYASPHPGSRPPSQRRQAGRAGRGQGDSIDGTPGADVVTLRPLLLLTAATVLAADTPSFEFGRDISGIFTRKGCNSVTCHGGVKGSGGFKLSPAALYPTDDYEWIVKGGGYQVLTAEVAGELKPRI